MRAKHQSARRLSSPRAEVLNKLVVAGIAAAALLSAVAPARAAPPAPMFNWSGFYAGGNVGYGWDHASSRFPDDFTFIVAGAPNPLGFPSHGMLGGGGFGYNWLFARNWVGGIEVDFNAANLRGSDNYNIATSPLSAVLGPAQFKTDFFGTARVRFGYAVNNALWYATGGYAWARERLDVSGTGVSIFGPFSFDPSSDSRIANGWVIGGGLEWAWAPNWSTKLEYLRLDFGSHPFTIPFVVTLATGNPVRVSSHVDVVRIGLNYRFGNP